MKQAVFAGSICRLVFAFLACQFRWNVCFSLTSMPNRHGGINLHPSGTGRGRMPSESRHDRNSPIFLPLHHRSSNMHRLITSSSALALSSSSTESVYLQRDPRNDQQVRKGRGTARRKTPRRDQLVRIAEGVENLMKDEYLCSGGRRSSGKELVDVLKQLASANDSTQVVSIGRQLSLLLSVEEGSVSPKVRERIIKATATTGLVSIALNLTDSLLEEGLIPSEMAQDSLCRTLRQLGRITRLGDTLKRIGQVAKRKGAAVSQTSYNMFLAAMCDPTTQDVVRPNWSPQNATALLQEAFDLLSIERTSTNFGLLPDVVSYNTVLAAASGNKTMVDAIWNEMRARNVPPDTMTYNALMSSRKASDDQVMEIWNQMSSDILTVHPDRYTIDLVLAPLVKAGQIGDVEALLDRFVAKNSDRVASKTFGAFLSTLVTSGDVASARALFETYIAPSFSSGKFTTPSTSKDGDYSGKRKLRFISPSTRHFNVLIEGYRKQALLINKDDVGSDRKDSKTRSLYSEAWDLYELMLAEDIPIDDYTVTSLIGVCHSSKALSNFLVDISQSTGLTISSAVLRATCTKYGELGDPSSACWIFANYYANSDGASKATRYWNVLLSALARGSEVKAGRLNIWNSSASKALHVELVSEPSSSVKKIFESITSLECWQAASILSDHIEEPNSQTFCLLAKALQYGPTNGQVATELIRNATVRQIPSDGRFVNAALRCFGDDIDSALEAWKGGLRMSCIRYESLQSKTKLKFKNLVAAYNGLLYVCGRALRPDIALRLIFAMKKEGLEPNEACLNSYKAGAAIVRNRPPGETKLGQKLRDKLKLIDPYESLLEVECLKYDENDKRRMNEKKVRIII